MSHLAKLAALTDDLVEAVTSTSAKTDRESFPRLRDNAWRNVRHHSFLRTNQFDVDHQLKGLEERFRVQHREALADAIKERLDALELIQTKWHPDILHFLLELADKPVQKTDLHDLELLRVPEEVGEPGFRWEDIAAEDGWDQDPDIWKTVHFSDSSDDGYQTDATNKSEDTSPSDFDLAQTRRPEDLAISTEDSAALNDVQTSQAWRLPEPTTAGSKKSQKTIISEFHVIREFLFMLQGLETTLFSASCIPNPVFQMQNILWDTYKALITSCAESGRKLLPLRLFSRSRQTTPLLQTFHASVAESLGVLDAEIARIQARLVAPRKDVVVSLVSIQRELKPHLEPLYSLASIVRQLDEAPGMGAFRYLELLYREVAVAQSEDRMATYRFLGRIFFDCFQVYLRPIRLWMQEGQLLPGDKIFFVSSAAAQVPLHKIWREKYKLRKTSDGKLHVPDFLQPSVARIFTAGKSILVLKQLGKFHASSLCLTGPEPVLTFESVCSPGLEFAPFPELFGTAFTGWLHSKHSATSEALKAVLFNSCGLLANIEALERLYFMSNGSAGSSFSQTLFAKIDSKRVDWQDRYLLTGLAQEAFSTVLDAPRLTAAVVGSGNGSPATRTDRSIRHTLPSISVKYRLDWPVQLVVTGESLERYQTVFTFLLQIRRASSFLQKRRLLDEVSLGGDWQSEAAAASYRVRCKLLWFCNLLQTYLTTVVLGPSTARLRRSLSEAPDVDAMITLHLNFTKQVIDAACLGAKLAPIKDGILDLLDVATELDRVEASNKAQQAKEHEELSSQGEQSYLESLQQLNGAVDGHLRFICGGLRGVARASGENTAGQWDLFAEMLEAGSRAPERFP
ncbi:Spc97/Spc98 family protein [Plectosphaerella plurivora]|uniref:Spindle pole body component n=1 Tax=Plectosphaerella plurivora TaxID=936078 RepID=A0A9P9A7Z0_9PEZI|nr:Spc97/Spc98 family protein [Plectosphaerella plurivora]